MYRNYNEYPYYYERPVYFLPQEDIQAHLNQGRANHCFKAYWAGREHTFILTGLQPNGTVTYIENGQPGIVSRQDIVGLTYLGVQCPQPGPGQGQGPGQGPGPGPGQGPGPGGCRWMYFQGYGWYYVCN